LVTTIQPQLTTQLRNQYILPEQAVTEVCKKEDGGPIKIPTPVAIV